MGVGIVAALLGLALLVSLGFSVALLIAKSRADAEHLATKADRDALSAHLSHSTQELQVLSRYRHIVDVEAEVRGAREALYREQQSAQQQLSAQHAALQHEIQAARAGIAREQQVAQQDVAARRGAAHTEAAAIIAAANQQANAVAGEALEAKGNLEIYRREARALKNLIDGYGTEYVVPSHSVLDDLAESFGFTEAGQNLKSVRQRIRQMVKDGTAAACNYVEANRRETAIAFVVDAFNGKVDTILSGVKGDNVGTLRQKIQDAFALVNLNGKAFRDARIQNDYLALRLEELRWAAAAQELREREREEQRRIKEQIREEEKARREYERAMKEAAKEEDAIRKAMERVQKDVEKSSEAQRAKYEAQLLELTSKLHQAEAKNQRALSMAQQTKTGHVYIISNVGSFGEDVFKIGLTRRLEPADRIRELGDASVPFEFDVHALILSDDAPSLERALHKHFLSAQLNKVNPRKEFFRAPLSMIRQELERLGIQTSWTMAAAAVEYRESLAIEKAIKDDPASYQAWLNRQLVLDPVVLDDPEQDSGFTLVRPVTAMASHA